MKKMLFKKGFHITVLLIGAIAISISLTGCKKATDLMYYLYGSDKSIKKEEAQVTYDGTNGVSLVYDANVWEEPYMVQEDTISIVSGTSFNYTAVLLQTTDTGSSGKKLRWGWSRYRDQCG